MTYHVENTSNFDKLRYTLNLLNIKNSSKFVLDILI